MAKLIDAWDAAEAVSKHFGISIGKLVDVFAEIPAVVPKTDKEPGTWTEKIVNDPNDTYGFLSRRWYCSECGGWNTYGESKFCPECGKKMKRKQDEDENYMPF